MNEHLHVEKPLREQLAALGWQVADQGQCFIPSDPSKRPRTRFREARPSLHPFPDGILDLGHEWPDTEQTQTPLDEEACETRL